MSIKSIKCVDANVGQIAKAIKKAYNEKPELIKLMKTLSPDSFTKSGEISKKAIVKEIYNGGGDYFTSPFSKKSTLTKEGKKMFALDCIEKGLNPSISLYEMAKLSVKDKLSSLLGGVF